MTKLLLATQNPGKIREIRSILSELPITVAVATEELDVEETGSTFEANAILKAKAYQSHYPNDGILADDSGLVVDALNGGPGVFSHRYGDSDQKRNQKLLAELLHVPIPKRTARFVTVMVLLTPKEILSFEGRLEGSIALTAKGSDGFGYDPVFIPEGFQLTLAELGTEKKNTMSHRMKALSKLKHYLLVNIGR